MSESLTMKAALAVLVLAAVAGCGGGVPGPTTIPSPAASAAPTATPTPTPPSGGPTPTSAPTPVPFVFHGATAAITVTAGITPAPLILNGYPATNAVSATVQFGAPTTGSGSFAGFDALNNGDVTGAVLPPDALQAYTYVIYFMVQNNSASDMNFGGLTPGVQLTRSGGFGTATSCELDVFGGGGSSLWQSVGVTGTIGGSSVNLAQTAFSGQVDIMPGQQVVAVGCR